LLTGRPGTGKTILVKEVLDSTSIKCGGFYTEEIRTGSSRQGFRIVTLDGQSAILAHVDSPSPHRVGKYGVYINNFNRVGVTALRQATQGNSLIVIDEIGKMELLSEEFQQAVTQAMSSNIKILGTIMSGYHPFAVKIKNLPGVKTLQVTENNHRQVLAEILIWLETQ